MIVQTVAIIHKDYVFQNLIISYLLIPASSATACTGRRKKTMFGEKKSSSDLTVGTEMKHSGSEDLESSLKWVSDIAETSKAVNLAKTLLTVWSTISSTRTVTVYTTNTSTTVSISAACTVSSATVTACG